MWKPWVQSSGRETQRQKNQRDNNLPPGMWTDPKTGDRSFWSGDKAQKWERKGSVARFQVSLSFGSSSLPQPASYTSAVPESLIPPKPTSTAKHSPDCACPVSAPMWSFLLCLTLQSPAQTSHLPYNLPGLSATQITLSVWPPPVGYGIWSITLSLLMDRRLSFPCAFTRGCILAFTTMGCVTEYVH